MTHNCLKIVASSIRLSGLSMFVSQKTPTHRLPLIACPSYTLQWVKLFVSLKEMSCKEASVQFITVISLESECFSTLKMLTPVADLFWKRRQWLHWHEEREEDLHFVLRVLRFCSSTQPMQLPVLFSRMTFVSSFDRSNLSLRLE